MKAFEMILISTLITIVFLSGCVSQEESGFQADSPTLFRPGARSLIGTKAEDLVVKTNGTVVDTTMGTRLTRQVAEKSQPAVVSIFVKSQTPYRLKILPISPFKGIRIRVPGVGLGSGFFIHPSGYILTNNHVIENAEQIRILTSEGEDYGVSVLARDPAYDLALLKIQSSEKQQFPVLAMGDSEKVGAGDMVIAIGNPLGLGLTVTAGIISQTDRNIMGKPAEGERHVSFIQTDTAINPGSSGGPLLTLSGAWVGVNTAGVVQAQNIGFAVPSKQVLEFLDEVREGKGIMDQ
ncbi:MAG: S1C family serine protease [Planctomycetota bacterium]|jgi:serine protease Do